MIRLSGQESSCIHSHWRGTEADELPYPEGTKLFVVIFILYAWHSESVEKNRTWTKLQTNPFRLHLGFHSVIGWWLVHLPIFYLNISATILFKFLQCRTTGLVGFILNVRTPFARTTGIQTVKAVCCWLTIVWYVVWTHRVYTYEKCREKGEQNQKYDSVCHCLGFQKYILVTVKWIPKNTA